MSRSPFPNPLPLLGSNPPNCAITPITTSRIDLDSNPTPHRYSKNSTVPRTREKRAEHAVRFGHQKTENDHSTSHRTSTGIHLSVPPGRVPQTFAKSTSRLSDAASQPFRLPRHPTELILGPVRHHSPKSPRAASALLDRQVRRPSVTSEGIT